ncbi:10382_t:CDS:2 [Ambispora gerdemannii]|uniref:10382_t:CDS:1 n=1 Tax=Ambispora gerdemannii TaxID=144530 RepID=A0A9N9CR27_9GLOM|nr:10382_t:CDS:2 [Ambispora gerdemannii]
MPEKQLQTIPSSQPAGSSFFKGIMDFFADTTKNARHDFGKFKEGISLGFLVQLPDQQKRTFESGETKYFTDSRAILDPRRHRKSLPNFQKTNRNIYKHNPLKQRQSKSGAFEIERGKKNREKDLWHEIKELNQKVALLEKIVSELRATNNNLNSIQNHNENYNAQFIPLPPPPPPPPLTTTHGSSLTVQALIHLRNNLKTIKNQENIKTTAAATIEPNKCYVSPQHPSHPTTDMTALLEDLKNVKLRRTNLLRSTSGYISSISTPNSEQDALALVLKRKFRHSSEPSLSSSISTISIDSESTYNNFSSPVSKITCQSENKDKDLENHQHLLGYSVKRQKT